MCLKISSAKWRPFCPGGDELTPWSPTLSLSACIFPASPSAASPAAAADAVLSCGGRSSPFWTTAIIFSRTSSGTSFPSFSNWIWKQGRLNWYYCVIALSVICYMVNFLPNTTRSDTSKLSHEDKVQNVCCEFKICVLPLQLPCYAISHYHYHICFHVIQWFEGGATIYI